MEQFRGQTAYTKMKRSFWLVLFLSVGVLIVANGQRQGPEEKAFTAIDPVAELRLARVEKARILAERELSSNAQYIEIIDRIGHRIAQATNERADLADDWEFILLKSDLSDQAKCYNAFSIGGGTIFVEDSLLDFLTINGKLDEDMLASILGHEITHAVHRHVLLGTDTLESFAWIVAHLETIEIHSSKGSLTDEETVKLNVLGSARFQRSQEFEADTLGALFALRAGYNGFTGALRWMNLAIEKKMSDYTMNEYLPFKNRKGEYVAVDHPTWQERIAKLQEYKDYILNVANEFNWGIYALQSYNFSRAADCFTEITKLFPDCFEGWNNLALAYHGEYLATSLGIDKFQPSLLDYFIPLAQQVRGESPLAKAIRYYRRALAINPSAARTKANLAVALIETREPDDLTVAEQLLKDLLASDPANRDYLNDYGILTYWLAAASPDDTPRNREAELNFRKAADLGSQPAIYNLAMLQLENKAEDEALQGLEKYLAMDHVSPWAKRALAMLQERNRRIAFRDKPPLVSDILNIRLGATPEQVVQVLGQPERKGKCIIEGEEVGETYYFPAIGLEIEFAGGKVFAIEVLEASSGKPALDDLGRPPAPIVAGVALGMSVEELVKVLGDPVQQQVDSRTLEKLYYYASGDAVLVFRIRRSTSAVNGILLTSRKFS